MGSLISLHCCHGDQGKQPIEDDLMSLTDITPVQYEAIVRLQRNVRGAQSRQKTARRRETLHYFDKQELLGVQFMKKYMVATNRPENDAHWDSTDKEWVGRASMAKRHRFLIRRDLNWRWFNGLVFGMIDANGNIGDKDYCAPDAVEEVERMKEAALTYVENARDIEEWSNNIGLFYHIYGHNSVNSMHLHIVDLDFVGPGFKKMAHKNIPIDAVLQVLRECADASRQKGNLVPTPRKVTRREMRASFIKSTFKSDTAKACPRVNDAATFRAARANLWKMGGPKKLKEVLINEGYLEPGDERLTTATVPFNVFARIAYQDNLSRTAVSCFGKPRGASLK